MAARRVVPASARNLVGKAKNVVADSTLGTANEIQEKLTQLKLELARSRSRISELAAENEALRSAAGAPAAVASAVKNAHDEVRSRFNRFLTVKVNTVLDKVGEELLETVQDDSMPHFVQRGMDSMIRSVWDQVKANTMEKIVGTFRTEVFPESSPPSWLCLGRFRAWLMNTLFPHDRTIWQSLHNPSYLFLSLLCAFPLFGVPQICYLLLFLAHDWRDEYQLCQFILGFKGVQFLAVGVYPSLVGSGLYFRCVYDSTPGSGYDGCGGGGGGPQLHPLLLLAFAVQILLVYTAFALLPCSLKKGRRRFRAVGSWEAGFDGDGDGILDADDLHRMHAYLASSSSSGSSNGSGVEGMEEGKADSATAGGAGSADGRTPARGGVIRYFVWYDMLCLAAVLAVAVVAMVAGENRPTAAAAVTGAAAVAVNGTASGAAAAAAPAGAAAAGLFGAGNWRLQQSLYWCRVLYGLLSWPFAVFKIPVLSGWLTRAHPTGYNIHGVCVPRLTKAQRRRLADIEQQQPRGGQRHQGRGGAASGGAWED